MAIYKNDMADVELNTGIIHRTMLAKTIGYADALANRFGVRVFRDGEPEDLTGVTCTGYFIMAGGGTVAITNGQVSGNEAYVTLTSACYAEEGVFSLAIKLSGGSVNGTVRIVDGVVCRTETSTVIDPGTILPSIDTLLDAIETAIESIPQDYSTLSSTVSSLERIQPQTLTGTFTAGKTLDSIGRIATSNTRIATEPFTYAQGAVAISVKVVTGYRINIYTYSTGAEASFVRSTGWKTADARIELEPNDKYIRWTIASVGDATTLTVDDANKATAALESEMICTVQNLTESAEDYERLKTRRLKDSGWTASTFQIGGMTESGDNATNNNRIRTIGYIDVEGFDSLHYDIDDGYRAYFYAYESDSVSTFIGSTTWAVKTGIWMFPAGTKKIRACYASIDGTALTTSDYNKVSVSYGTKGRDIIPEIADTTRWIAIGDSITMGVYSTGESATTNAKIYGWADRFAASMGYELTKMASRGIGFEVTGQDPQGGDTRISFSTLLGRVTDLEGEYNLITVAIGINDYNSSTTLEQIATDVGATISTLATRFPNARIVFITPFNICSEGNAASQYAYNYTKNGRTLKDVADTIKTACDSCGVECVNATNGFIFNTINIMTLEPDGVHPSFYAHTLIAKGMARYLIN